MTITAAMVLAPVAPLATTPTKTQPTRSLSVTAVKITDTTPQGLRINLGLFWRAADWRPSTNLDLSSDFNIFLRKCGRLAQTFGFPKLIGPARDDPARISDRYTPYANFLRLLATSHMHLIFPKTRPPEGRSVLHHMRALSRKSYSPFGGRSEKICFFNIITYFFIKVKSAT